MRIHLVTIGISLVRLVDAEYKYYCDFMDEMVAQCIGKRKGGRISTLSQHGALIQPAEQSNDIRFTSDVCDIQDRPEGYGRGYLHVNPHRVCRIQGMQRAKMSYQRAARVRGPSTYYYLTYPRSDVEYLFNKIRPMAMEKLQVPRCQQAGVTVATFESHWPRHWKAELVEQDYPVPPRRMSKRSRRYGQVRRLKAKFTIKSAEGAWQHIPILGTADNIMKLDATLGHGDGTNFTEAEAFFFEIPTRGDPRYGVMVTSRGEPTVLFDADAQPPPHAEHRYYPSTRYPSQPLHQHPLSVVSPLIFKAFRNLAQRLPDPNEEAEEEEEAPPKYDDLDHTVENKARAYRLKDTLPSYRDSLDALRPTEMRRRTSSAPVSVPRPYALHRRRRMSD
ncbi:hypothetical protein FOZ60_016737 [Perkinsus olseni]|uniref:Uncharacterized protein n=1 Tax=Perkinsus olseni TaxID=32597 RepID=A0A7J6P490_PEROL|nr:hypothetical protein FOZ60_016737 [Perkinsus olseni]